MTGIDKAAADMDAMMAEPAAPAAPASPAPAPAKPAEPAKPATPAAEPETDEQKFEKEIKPNAKAWRTFEGVKKKWTSERQRMETKIKELESRPATPANDAKLKSLEEQLAKHTEERTGYEKTIAELDYRKSSEFNEKFVTRYQRTVQQGVEFAKQLKIVDEVGDPVREATEADFNAVKNATPTNRRAVAKQLFGENAADVVDYVRELDKIRAEADDAVRSHAENHAKIKTERTQKEAEEGSLFKQMRSDSEKLLETKYPNLFSTDHYKDQPELQKALADGYSYVDEAAEKAAQMSPDERAAKVSVVRARAASFPLLWTQNKSLKSQVDALTEELKKYRATDPGSAPSKPAGTPAGEPEATGGIDSFAAEFDKA